MVFRTDFNVPQCGMLANIPLCLNNCLDSLVCTSVLLMDTVVLSVRAEVFGWMARSGLLLLICSFLVLVTYSTLLL